ncbi:hypothetical protein NC651_022611 [Populus alba x Populus x berolinensis]|nr:hypothetical protein NC651_022611 [Populus alba x Populus x berolinensis]
MRFSLFERLENGGRGLLARSAFVNGACHWLAYDPLKRDDASHVIYTFTLRNGVFGDMAIPDC